MTALDPGYLALKEATGKSRVMEVKKKTTPQTTRGRRVRGARGGASERVTRPATTASQAIDIPSDESSDDGFRNLCLSGDGEFNASEDGDKAEGDGGMD